MYKRNMYKAAALTLVGIMTLSFWGCGSGSTSDSSTEIVTDPAERGTVTVTLGRQTTANPKFPSGDSYEDNAYIRMTEEKLNIDIQDEFEAESGDDYNRQVSLALSAGSLPSMMKVASKDELTELYENELIADLTDVYDQYASDYIKGIYDSFDGRALANVTYDGKIMAIPATASDAGTSMCWVRSDWVESLGLTVDEDGD